MKKRDILLDFTSLLDVTLIIIFFFVLFSHLDSEQNRAETEAKTKELETAIQVAEERETEADALIAQLEENLAIVESSNERQSSNVKEMIEYSNSGNIKLILVIEEDDMLLRVNCKEEVVAEIPVGDDMNVPLETAIQSAGYSTDDTLFCDFVFDGNVANSAYAYRKVTKAIETIRKDYKFLYFSETDLSVGEE